MKQAVLWWAALLFLITLLGLCLYAGVQSAYNAKPLPTPEGTRITTCTLQEFWRYDPATKMTQPYWVPVCETHYRMGGASEEE